MKRILIQRFEGERGEKFGDEILFAICGGFNPILTGNEVFEAVKREFEIYGIEIRSGGDGLLNVVSEVVVQLNLRRRNAAG